MGTPQPEMEIFRVRIDLAVGKNLQNVVGSYNTARIFEFFYLRISVQHNLKEAFSGRYCIKI